jgi:hypothetical protein
MNDGASLDEAKVKAALQGKGMGFESMEKTELTRPQAAYSLVVSGAT